MQLRVKSSLLLRKTIFFPSFKTKYNFSQYQNKEEESKINQDFLNSSKKSAFSNFFNKFFGPKSYTANESFKKRWLMVVPAFLCHVCIGSPWAWSVVASFF